MPLASETYDFSLWYYSASEMLKGFGIYSSHTFSYPPLWAYTMLPFVRLLTLFVHPAAFGQSADSLASEGITAGMLQPIASSPFVTAVKLPLLAADIAAAILIYKVVSEVSGRDRAISCVGLWILSPTIIWTSFGHGQFDVLPAVLTLVSSYLLYKRHSLSAGAALSLAILYKLYPILFIPLYLALLAVDAQSELANRERLKSLLRFLVGLAAPAAFFLAIPTSSGFLDSLSSRAGLIPYFGGFGPFTLLNLPEFATARQTFTLNSQLATWALLTIQLALSILVALKMTRRARVDPFSAIVLGHIFILIILIVSYPLTNPQYIVWILPFLTLLYGVRDRFMKRSLILSTLGFLFNIIWVGPGSFFYTASLSLGAPSVTSLLSIDQALRPFALTATAFFQAAGFAVLLSCFKPNLNILPIRQVKLYAEKLGRDSSTELSLDPRIAQRMESLLRLGLVFLVASVAFVGLNPLLTSSPSLTVYDNTFSPATLRAEARLGLVGGTYAAHIVSLLMPLRTAIHQPPVYIYFDPTYPSSLTDLRGWTGVLDHLPFELQTRGYPSNITQVNAVELAGLIDSSTEAAIVIPSGVLPSTTSIPSLRSFLANGGTLFWMGDRIGYYLSMPSLTLDQDSPENPRYTAQEQLFGGIIVSENYTSLDHLPGQINPPYEAGDSPTALSRALNLNYPATIVGASLSALPALGGTALGTVNTRTNQASLAVIPVGMGRVVLFGAGVTFQFASSGEMTIAADIAQIMAGGLLDSTFEFVLQEHAVNPHQTVNTTITLNLSASQPVAGVLLVSYSPDPHIAFFTQKVFPP